MNYFFEELNFLNNINTPKKHSFKNSLTVGEKMKKPETVGGYKYSWSFG